MFSRLIEGPGVVRLVPFAAVAAFLALPADRAGAQAEFNLGPFLTYNTLHGGRPAASGLQTGILIGPVGLRASGFTALDQPSAGSPDAPRWGGDADLLFIFDLSSRGGGRPGLAPYLFAGAGLTVQRDSATFFDATRYPSSSSSLLGAGATARACCCPSGTSWKPWARSASGPRASSTPPAPPALPGTSSGSASPSGWAAR